MEAIKQFINDNKENYVNELVDFLKIPTISTLDENKPDMQKGAEFVAEKLKAAGIDKVEIYQTEGHPIVYGEWLKLKGAPTVMFYGHYDVQPVDPIDLWNHPPFDPVINDNKIWARGATDDKGQLYVHIKSVEAYLKTKGTLPVNVKFLIEGEEEIGSPNLKKFLEKNKKLLKSDSIVVSDTSMYDVGLPTITYGLRGLSYLEVTVQGPDRDLHSGSYGGGVANPANVLVEMIASLKDQNGKIKIPHFYDDVVKLTKVERDNFKRLKFSEKEYAKEIKVRELFGEKGFSTLERLWCRPTLDINGIWGGFTGVGAKTIIPSKAAAKISMRLVPNQDPVKIAKLVKEHILKIAPKSVRVDVQVLHGGYPVLSPLDGKGIKAVADALSKVFGKKTVFTREGGSIPIIADFAKTLGVETVLMGLGLDSENLHSPNEHFSLNHFHLGILSSAQFLENYSK